MRAVKLQKRAARVGFDWPELAQVLDKIDEELAEVKAELAEGAAKERLHDEVGDLLFVVVNLARHLDIDPESALRHTNAKFERRFRSVETELETRGLGLRDASLDQMETAWQNAKRSEKSD
jgi:ATP diphosphatase